MMHRLDQMKHRTIRIISFINMLPIELRIIAMAMHFISKRTIAIITKITHVMSLRHLASRTISSSIYLKRHLVSRVIIKRHLVSRIITSSIIVTQDDSGVVTQNTFHFRLLMRGTHVLVVVDNLLDLLVYMMPFDKTVSRNGHSRALDLKNLMSPMLSNFIIVSHLHGVPDIIQP